MSEKRIVDNNADPSAFFRSAEQTVGTTPENKGRKKRPVGVMRTIGFAALTGVVIGGAGVAVNGVSFYNGFANAAGRITTEGSIEDMGKAEIVRGDMKIQPITLSTTDSISTGTKAVFETKFESDLFGGFELGFGDESITRAANVSTFLNFSPDKIELEYDPEDKQLTFIVDSTALTTQVEILTGGGRTTDETGNIFKLPVNFANAFTNALEGAMDKDLSGLPILGDLAEGSLTIKEALERYADLTIVTEVDKACTPLIPEYIPDFKVQLEENIITLALGQLVDPNPGANIPEELNEFTVPELREVVKDAKVEFVNEFEFGPDEDAIKELEDLKKSKFFTSVKENENSMTCGIKEDPELNTVEEDSDE